MILNHNFFSFNEKVYEKTEQASSNSEGNQMKTNHHSDFIGYGGVAKVAYSI